MLLSAIRVASGTPKRRAILLSESPLTTVYVPEAGIGRRALSRAWYAPTVPLTGLVEAAGVATGTVFETTTVEVMPFADVMTLVLVMIRRSQAPA